MLPALLALAAASLFTGAAVYISLAEHPARLGLSEAAALAQWQPSYRRAVPMQAGLALISAALGLWAWWGTREPLLLAGALLILAVVPFTLIVIMPTNKRLMAASPETAGPDLRPYLVRWGTLHGVRGLLGLAAMLAFLAALAR
jgi:uncharacterized membrane protein